MTRPDLRRIALRVSAPLTLALLAYLPALTSAPGRMPTDTKLFLYLDPGRLMGDAASSWDARQFGGWVPHQVIAYLWPSGPWFWLFDTLGVPDWVAHRLWIGTILFLGGLGVRFAARALGLVPLAALVAAVVYQLSPYVLPYVSRTSVMLLPWAGVGWLVGLTVRATRRGGWLDPALFALVVFTVGAVNATATALIAPAPLLFIAHAAVSRTISPRRALATLAKLGGLSLVVSLWWIVMLSVQGRYGGDVLAYSETLQAVSLTSTGTETLRGLGYWLFYVRDPYAFTTTASVDYMMSTRVVLAGYGITALGLAGLAFTRWSQRRFAALLVLAGVVLAVGVHPIWDPSPLFSGPASASRSTLALALRSSTRALPLSTFGLALGAGALVSALHITRRRLLGLGAAALILVLAVVDLPALWRGGLVDSALERDQHPPAAWTAAAAALDARATGYRVLQLPGAEFGAFRWGYTVDPPLPGLTTRALITRDLLPLGSAGVMDLSFALDQRFQDGTLDSRSLAPVARLLGADVVWVPGDLAWDRFRNPRPEVVRAIYEGAPGIGDITDYGPAVPDAPVRPIIDEQSVSDAAIGEPVPPVSLAEVDRPLPIVRAKTTVVVVAGSGDGIIDATAAGVLDGTELLRPAATLPGDGLANAAGAASQVIVTDSNRRRAHHWRGTQDVWGFTEPAGDDPAVLRFDYADQTLPVYPDETEADETLAEQRGPVQAVATAYGEDFAYRPEDRAVMAIDGDASTAWLVADHSNPLDENGESIRLRTESAVARLGLAQPDDAGADRWITRVRVSSPSFAAFDVDLGDASRGGGSQPVELPAPAREVMLTVTGISGPGGVPGLDAVGFSEIDTGLGATEEVVRVPTDAAAATPAGTPLTFVLTRDRTRSTNRWRSDPEPAMVRALTVSGDRSFMPVLTVRLSARAADSVLARVLGHDGASANRRLIGVPAAGGWAAVDGDPDTAWTTPFGDAVGSVLTLPLTSGEAPARLRVSQIVDDEHSLMTTVSIRAGDQTVDLPVPSPDADGTSTLDLRELAGVSASSLQIAVTATDGATTLDRRYNDVVGLPVGVAEVEGDGIATAPLPTAVDGGCRDDLVTIDGEPYPVRVRASTADLLAGEAVPAQPCGTQDITLNAGEHIVRSMAGAATGWDVDQVVLRDPDAPKAGGALAPTTVTEHGRTSRTITVGPCPDGCWLVSGEGFNPGWEAGASGVQLGPQQAVDGGFGGWWVPPSDAAVTVTMRWTPQRRLNIALALGALGVAACAGLAVVLGARLVRRRRQAGCPPVADPARNRPRVLSPWASDGLSGSVVGAVALVGLSALVVAPRYGVAALVPAIAMVLTRRARPIAVAAAALAAGLGLTVAWRVHRFHYFADAAWPGRFEDLHRAGLFVVVLVAAGALWTDRTDRAVSAEEPGQPEEGATPSAASTSTGPR